MRDPMQRGDATPTIEVRAYRDGTLVGRTLCESEQAAMEAVEDWSEVEGVVCEVDDLSFRHRAGDVFEPDPSIEVPGDGPDPGLEDRSPSGHGRG